MKLSTASLTLATLLLPCHTVHAFSPVKTNNNIYSASIAGTTSKSTILYALNEKDLRAELKEKTSIVDAEAEIKYGSGISGETAESEASQSKEEEEEMGGVVETEAVVKATSETETQVTTTDSSESTAADDGKKKKLERALKPRSYPLFLAEKGAILVEDMTNALFNDKKNKLSAYDKYQQKQEGKSKEKVVILGTGWGSAAFLKEIDTSMYDVTVISPRNFFLFTPMLAGASVGTVEYRSICESIREINDQSNYLEGTATFIDPKTKTISCESVVCEGNSCSIEDFDVSYDKLIVTVGAQTNTFGIPGVREHCCFLKQVEDARMIRTSIVNCFERANLPDLTDEKKIAILTFAVIGAGPTGVEFASELRDFIEEDGPKYYPDLLKYVRIKVIEASPTILAPFDKSLQEEAINQLTRGVKAKDPSILQLLPEKFQLTELLLNSGVSEVKEDIISLNDGREIPYGLAVWAAGNGPLPITLQLIDELGKESDQGEAQSIARGRLAVDPWLRVSGSDGSIFSYGDCSCITYGQLPATAQVASQQGEYLARLLSQDYDMCPGRDPDDNSLMPPRPDSNREKTLAEKISTFAIQSDDIAAPFQFLNLGILAYTGGGSALAQLQLTPQEQTRVKGTGKIGFGLWRSVYLSKQVSSRNRILVLIDWTKQQVFGRDITRL